jgi:uncharacterized membrane protein
VRTKTFVIGFIFVADKSAFHDLSVQRRIAAKIFACFLAFQNRAKNITGQQRTKKDKKQKLERLINYL